MGYLMITSLQS